MRTALSTILSLALICLLASTADSAEYNLKIEISSRAELPKLTRLVSIESVSGNTVYAVAVDEQIALLDRLGWQYEVIRDTLVVPSPKMAASPEEAAAWDSYPSYGDYVSMMWQFDSVYSSICTVFNIGTTVQGRDLLVVKISDNVASEEFEPEVLFTSSMHGNETAGYVLMLRLIDSLLSTYGSNARVTDMVDNMEIWINPLANPDGTYITGDASVSGASRSNANSVDLNRNFPDPQDGSHPDGKVWQPETIAMMQFAGSHSFVISANFHGGAEVMNYPWDTWSQRHADDAWWIDVCRQWSDSAQANSPAGYMTDLNNGITNGWDWFTINGGRQDYMNYFQGTREVTVELSAVKLLAGSSLPAHWIYNKSAMLDYLEQARYGIKGLVTDATTTFPLDAVVSVLNHDVDSSEVYTDPDVGDYHRMIEAGSYDLVFSSPGYLPDTIFSVVVTDGNVTTVNAQLQSLPAIPLLSFVSHDAGGIFAGDTVLMKISLVNNGGANATGLIGTLAGADSCLEFIQDSSSYPTLMQLGGNGMALSTYRFVIDSNCTAGKIIGLSLNIVGDGGLDDTLTFLFVVDQPIEDYESGNFSNFSWISGGSAAWQVQSSQIYEGAFAAQSGAISHNQLTQMVLQSDTLLAGEISFFYKVSSEGNFDFLNFYIDDIIQDSWSGQTGWAGVSFPVSSGTHAFKWEYTKDVTVSIGDDRAWVDYIVLPVKQPPSALLCGDINGSGGEIDISDLTYLVAWMFGGGPPPPDLSLVDVDGTGGDIDISDLTYLVAYMFGGGPDPACL